MSVKTRHILERISGFLVILVAGGFLALQIPALQERLAVIVLGRLNEAFDGRITVSGIRLLPSGTLEMNDLLLQDDDPYVPGNGYEGCCRADTILYARDLSVTFALRSLYDRDGIHLNRVIVKNGLLHLTIEPGPGGTECLSSNIERMLGPASPSPDATEADPFVFSIKQVRISEFTFRMNSYILEEHAPVCSGIDYADMEATAHELRARDLSLKGGIMSGVLEHMQASEKSGYVLDHMEGSARVGMGKTIIDNLLIVDPGTRLRFDAFSMSYGSSREFADFVNKVRFDAVLHGGVLSMSSVSKFASGALDGNDSVLLLKELDVHGPVCNLEIRNLDFLDRTSGVSGKISGRLGNLPDAPGMTLDMNVRGVRFTMPEAARFIRSWSMGQAQLDFDSIAKGCSMVMNARTGGCINNLNISSDIGTGIGSLHADMVLKDIISPAPIGMDLRLSSGGLDLGRILGSPALGDASFMARAGMLLSSDGFRMDADTIHVRNVRVLGNSYSGIMAGASVHNNTLSASARCSDMDLAFRAKVRMDLGNEKPVKNYYADLVLPRADLAAMNLTDRSRIATIGLRFNLDASRGEGGIYTGAAHVGNFTLEGADGVSDMGEIDIRATPADTLQYISFTSPVFDASYLGSSDFPSIAANLENRVVGRHLPALSTLPAKNDSRTPFRLQVDFHETMQYLSRIIPGLYIADKTRMEVDFSGDGNLDAELSSPRLAFELNYFKDACFKLSNTENNLTASLSGSEMYSGKYGLKSPSLGMDARRGDFDISFTFDGTSHTSSSGRIFMEGLLEGDRSDSLRVSIRPVNSRIVTGKGVWTLSDSLILADKSSLRVNGLRASNGNRSISLDGSLSRFREDTLTLCLDSLDISAINPYMEGNYDLEGVLLGSLAVMSTTEGKTNLRSVISGNDIFIGDTPTGSILLKANMYNDVGEVDFDLEGNSRGHRTLTAGGVYRMNEETLTFGADFDGTPLAVAAPFLSDVLTGIGGTLDGSIRMDGPLRDISTRSSALKISDGLIGLATTGVEYGLDGPLRIEDGGIFLDGMSVSDKSGGKASLSGALYYGDFKDVSLDAGISFENLLVVDLPERSGADFYGTLRASGKAGISGPLSSLSIDGDVRSSGEGDLHVPLSGSLSSTRSDILSFKEAQKETDTYQIMLDEFNLAGKKKNDGDLRIKGRVTLTPAARAFLEVDKSVGNVISLGGQGQINVDLRPSKKQYNLNGDYNISEGKYHFVIPGLMDKDLNIENGSSVKFGGDLMDSQIDITARYNLKTSLSTLISDTTSVATRRPVECGLRITDKLRNPSLNFFIDVPDLEPNMKSQVESALNSEDKIQKQFVSLLFFGSFLPSEQSGVFNGTNMLYSNLGEVVSSQFNSILQKLDIPLDFGFGYQETQTGTNMFDVAVSTQLFNNRVEVKGSLGNRKYKTSGNGSSFAGDLDIEVKLDRAGRVRMSLFSHSADDYTNFLDNTQRNGLGISYTHDFNTFGEFFRNIFTPKKKRSGRGTAPEDNKQKIIVIDEPERKTVSDPLSAGRQ